MTPEPTCPRRWQVLSPEDIPATIVGRPGDDSMPDWEFADREILSKASEQLGEDVTDLRHSVEEKPTPCGSATYR
jgi:hypothetical protein